MRSRRIVLASAIVCVVIIGVFCFVRSGQVAYGAHTFVIAESYTNAMVAPAFERRVVQTIPGVVRLQVMSTTVITTLRSGATVRTNGLGIRIFAVGPTAEDAQRIANEAAAGVSTLVLTNYEIKCSTVEQARSARPCSFLHDILKPAVGRLFRK